MQVLHVLEATFGGTSRHVLDLARLAHGVDHEFAIPRRRHGWPSDEDLPGELRSIGATVHLVEMRRNPPNLRNLAALVALKELLRTRRPQIIHGHSSVGGALARLAAGGREGVPAFYTPNGVLPTRSALFIERLLARRTTRFIAVSASEADFALEHGLATTENLSIIPNGIDLGAPIVRERARWREALGAASREVIIGMLARLEPQKAPEVFVRACAEVGRVLPGTRFALLGDGSLLPAVEAEIRAADLGDRFVHVRQSPHLKEYLQAIDIFVSTARFEGAPYTPLDAIRAGAVPVLTDVVGNRDIVDDGLSGTLIPVDDVRATSDALVRLVRDDGLRRALSAGAQARLNARFDSRAAAATLVDAYYSAANPVVPRP